VFDLNSNFSNFPIATGKKWCGGMRMFGPWRKHLYFRSSPIHRRAVSDMIIFALSWCRSCIFCQWSSWGSSWHYAGIRFTIANGHAQISNLPSLLHIWLVHYWVINASTQCPWVQMFTSRIDYLISLLANMVPPITSVIWYSMTAWLESVPIAHVPLCWKHLFEFQCVELEFGHGCFGFRSISGMLDVLLHPICDLWAFHKLHFINESSDLSPTAWSMNLGLKDLLKVQWFAPQTKHMHTATPFFASRYREIGKIRVQIKHSHKIR